MANYANLLATIAANIYTNNNNEVTAAMVKTAVDAIVASLGAGYQFMDVATPATNPGNTDLKQFYIASTPGTYTNFVDSGSNPLEVNDGEVAVLKYDTAWSKIVAWPSSKTHTKSISLESLPYGYYSSPGDFNKSNTYHHIKMPAAGIGSLHIELMFPAPVPAIMVVDASGTILHSYYTTAAGVLLVQDLNASDLAGAAYIIVQAYDYNYFTYDFVLDVFYASGEKLALAAKPLNTLRVGKDDVFDFHTIQDAIDFIDDDYEENQYTIIVAPGEYEPFKLNINKARYISIIGENKHDTKVVCHTGKYADATTIMHAFGIIRGLTFVADFADFASEADYVTWINTPGNNGAYALHIDGSINTISQALTIEDCVFVSLCNSCLGIGLHQDETLTIKGCELRYEAPDAVATRFDRGAIYCHTYPVSSGDGESVTGQHLRLIENRFVGKNLGTLHPAHLAEFQYMSNDQGDADFLLLHNSFVPNGVARSKQVNLLVTYGSHPFADYINEASDGNNVDTLNKTPFAQ